MQVLLDVANMPAWGPQSVGDLYRNYLIQHVDSSDKIHYGRFFEQYFKVRKYPNLFFFHGNSNEKEAVKRDIPQEDCLIFPDDAKYEDGLHELRQFQIAIRDFLYCCTRGNIDIRFINNFLDESNIIKNIRFKPNDKDNWNPINDACLCQETFEEWVIANEIITPIFKNSGEIFSRVKNCPQCDQFFLGKSGKAKYCSDLCSKNSQRGKEPKQFTTSIA